MKEGYLKMIVIENELMKVSIAHNGAEVREVIHKESNLNYMWTGDPQYWGRVSPVLFPIVGKLADDQYQLEGEKYNMPQHGFLRDIAFDVHKKEKDTVSFITQSLGQYSEMYPYEFKVLIHYTLKGDSLTIKWEVFNQNNNEMYFSIGAHPAFKIPFSEDEVIEDYDLKLTNTSGEDVFEYTLKDSVVNDKNKLDNLKPFPLTASLFEDDALIYSNFEHIKLYSNTSNHSIEVTCNDFPFVGIWSKYDEDDKTIAPFICIEPWHGIADTSATPGDFKQKMGINKLESGDVFQSKYSIKFG